MSKKSAHAKGRKFCIAAGIIAAVLAAVTLSASVIMYNFSLNIDSPIHMSKLSNITQRVTKADSKLTDDEASQQYSGIAGSPEEKAWYAQQGEDIYVISDDGLKLHAKKQELQGSHLYAIVCHGYTSEGKHMAGFAKQFYDMGYTVLTLDARAHGESEGSIVGMGWPERMDILKWIGLVLSWDPDAQIVLYGVSMGGATVMNASGEKLPENVKAIVEDCGYSSVWDEFKWESKSLKIPSFPVLNIASLISKLRDGYSFKEASCIEQVKKSRTPTLFIHGGADGFVPTYMLDEVYDAAACEKEKLLISGAGHALSSSKNPELYWGTVENFLNKYVEK